MKKLIAGIFILILPLFLFPQEKYEITKVDIFSLDKFPQPNQISVLGISLGDSFDRLPAKYRRKSDFGFANVLDSIENELRIFLDDQKKVKAILLFKDFKNKVIGKTSEYFDTLSDGRLRDLAEKVLGPPDYINENKLPSYTLFYRRGFILFRIMSHCQFEICTEDVVQADITQHGAKKTSEINLDIPKPSISESAGFRKAMWGMTKNQVKQLEDAENIREEKLGGEMKGLEVLSYKMDIAGHAGVLAYYFAEDALTRGRYIITENHSEKNLYIKDFDDIKNQLSQKYGGPERDQAVWSNELYKGEPNSYGLAISAGQLTYVTEWYPKGTTIQLLLRGDNFKIQLWVDYTSDEFREFEKKVMDKAKTDIW